MDTQTHTITHTHALTHAHTSTHIHSHTHTLTHTFTHMHAHALAHACTHSCTCMHTHSCTHMHTHTHTHTHTHIHTRTQTHYLYALIRNIPIIRPLQGQHRVDIYFAYFCILLNTFCYPDSTYPCKYIPILSHILYFLLQTMQSSNLANFDSWVFGICNALDH